MSFQYPQQVQPEEKKPSGDPTLLIVGGLAVLVVLGGVALGAAFMLRPQTPTVVPTVSYDIPTAREAYPAAINLIRGQDVGALLVSAEGAWTPNINMTQLAAGRTGWTFYFYLPAKEQMASVIADTKSGVRIATARPWQTAPKVLDDRSWVADSSIGMNLFLQKCGGEIRDNREVISRMSTAVENGTLLWQRQVVTPDKQVVCEADTDARTGQPK
jgi:hypothetical protein